MAIQLNIDTTSVLQARNNVRELEVEYSKLSDSINELKGKEVLSSSDSDKLKSYTKELSSVNKELNELNKTIDELDSDNLTSSFEDMYGAVLPLSGQIGELEDRMYQLAISGQSNSEEFIKLSQRAGEFRAAIQQTDAQIDAMTLQSKGISGMGMAFSGVKDSLMNLDFKGAAANMNAFNSAMMGGDKGLKGIFNGLKTATSGVWQFTSALLANPIILIGAVIIGVGVALYKLKDSLGIVGVLFDAIGDVIGWVVDQFNKAIDVMNTFTDALGWTNVAEEKYAEEAHKRAEEKIKDAEVVDYARQKELDNQIKDIELKGKLTEKDIWNIGYLRKKKLESTKAVIEANAYEAYSYIKLQELKGDLSEEEKQELEDRKRDFEKYKADYKDINKQIEQNAKQTANEVKTFRDNESKEISETNKKRSEEAKKRRDEELKAEEDFRNKYNDLVSKSKAELDKILYEEDLSKLTNDFDKRIFIAEQKAAEEKSKVFDIIDKENEILVQQQVNLEKKLNDAIKSGNEEAINEIKAKVEANDNLIKSNGENRIKVETFYDKKLSDEKAKIESDRTEDEAKKEEEKNGRLMEIRRHFTDQIKNEEDKRYAQQLLDNEEYYKKLLSNTELSEEQRLAIIKEKAEKESEYQKEHLDNKEKIRLEDKQKEDDETKKNLEATLSGIKSGLEAVDSAYSTGLGNIGGSIISGFEGITSALNDPNLTGEERARAIAQASLQAAAGVLGGVNDILDAVSEANQAKTEEKLAQIDTQYSEAESKLQSQLDGGIISQEEFDRQKYKMDLDRFNKEEAIKKKQFEQDKKMKIAQATISMVQGMLSAFTGAMQLGPIAGPIVGGILAAAVGVMGAINIAKIKSTKYEGGTPPSAPSTPAIAMPNLAEPMASGSETGMSNIYSQGGRPDEDGKKNNEMTVKVESTVSVSELETTQSRLNRYEKNGEL